MISEGQGRVPPAPVRISVPVADARLLKRCAVDQATFRGYADRGGRWSVGLRRSGVSVRNVGYVARPERPVFCGLMGEWATCLYVQARVGVPVAPDLGRRAFGDFGVDLSPLGLKFQVKTRQRDGIPNLVRAALECGRRLEMPSDVFVFCRWTGGLDVSLLGWLWTRRVKARSLASSPVADHWNYEVRDDELSPMSRLARELKRRKARGC